MKCQFVRLALSAYLPIVLAAQPTYGQAPSAPAGFCGDLTADGRQIDCNTLAKIDALAGQAVALGEVPGLAVGIVRRGRVIFQKGYGKSNLELNTPVTEKTVFNIFSVTKPMTAALIFRLVEAGKMSLDDSVSTFFPNFPRGKEIKVRHLLGNTAGIHDIAESGPEFARMGLQSGQILQTIAGQSPLFDFDPGSRWYYSNSNFMLLGKIIERVSGSTYEQEMNAMFNALGMRNTAVDQPGAVVEGRASGYAAGQGPGDFRNYIFDISAPFAAGNVRSTVADLAKWYTTFFEGKVVNPVSTREMIAPARVNSGARAGDALWDTSIAPGSKGYWGLGIRSYQLDGHRATGPGGNWDHFSAKVTNYVDDNFMIIVLSNTGGKAGAIEERIAKIIYSDWEKGDLKKK